MESQQRLGCLRFVFGIPFVLAGIFIVPGAFLAPEKVHFTSESGTVTPPAVTALFGLCFLVCGLFALKFDDLAHEPLSMRKWGALVCLAFGVAIAAVALLDPDTSDMPFGRLPVALAGAIFLVAGAMMYLTTLPPQSVLRMRTEKVAVALLITLLAVLFTGIALSEELEGSGSVSIFGLEVPAPRWLDRGMAGLAALLLDALAVSAWVPLFRHGFTDQSRR